jgi:type VI secretion system secreted protein Hcp
LLCQDMHIAKFLDVTSPLLLATVTTGHRYSKIELVAVNTGAEVQNEFLRLTLQNVVISSVTFAGDNATSARVETLVLDPERIEITYTPQFADGRLGTPMSALADCSN